MLKNIGIVALLICGLYTDVQLWACKHAAAQTRIYVRPVCVSRGPCEYWELGFLDERGQFHFMQRMPEGELRAFLREKIMDGTLRLKE
jgi:hypothetical protein